MTCTKKVKVWDWFVQDDEDKPIKRLNGYTEESLCYYICQKIDGTEREVERLTKKSEQG